MVPSRGFAARKNRPALAGGFLSFLVTEGGQGKTDLNDDGDTRDWVMHVRRRSIRFGDEYHAQQSSSVKWAMPVTMLATTCWDF